MISGWLQKSLERIEISYSGLLRVRIQPTKYSPPVTLVPKLVGWLKYSMKLSDPKWQGCLKIGSLSLKHFDKNVFSWNSAEQFRKYCSVFCLFVCLFFNLCWKDRLVLFSDSPSKNYYSYIYFVITWYFVGNSLMYFIVKYSVNWEWSWEVQFFYCYLSERDIYVGI